MKLQMDKLKAKLNYMDILIDMGFRNLSSDDKYVRACCEVHGGDNPHAFYINKDNGLWYCSTQCQRGDDIFALVMELKKCDFKEALKYVCTISKVDLGGFKNDATNANTHESFDEWLSKIKGTKGNNEEYSPVLGGYEDLVEYKSFGTDICSHFKLGFAKEIGIWNGKTVKNKYTFPIYQGGKLVGLSLRAKDVGDEIKWMHLPKGLSKKMILYNYDELDFTQSGVILVEGMTDAMALVRAGYTNVVAILGSSLSQEQMDKLLMFVEVTILFDGDEAGKKATLKAISKLKDTFDVYVAKAILGKDPGDMSDDEIHIALKSRRRV